MNTRKSAHYMLIRYHIGIDLVGRTVGRTLGAELVLDELWPASSAAQHLGLTELNKRGMTNRGRLGKNIRTPV